MKRSSKLGAVVLAISAGWGCHKKTLPPAAPPPLPAAHNPPKRPAPTASPQPATPTVQNAPTPSPEPEFRLGQTLTPEEQRAYNAQIDQHIQRATQALGSVGRRALTAQQKTSMAQIRGFIVQAQQMRNTDVVRAKSLAERADILTQDLLSTVK
jgi:hypothetical protein